ncbi:hypothetical protein [Leptospira kanakyensis]|uniref:Uncharacterized protein n=1 Tax=Leptospira kanakyensis TaxID=2484968 RepID=A0A6N4QDU6_9LEPT|nr:hypothetical protein [Leptospira kanakyensis]MCW7470977.1 hypothetical protein [Leptospira kanakyensis]MCW7483107.1 hypothetical protein [Leptospira kanakyensis]TGK54350.1 hypothetical protein EHQ11_01990 [Leptospira kanakyensis]TGK58930.1 hypothetical protein EHQ16_11245 [Leptospira kanakyensis]TGK75331.1 hypothetical protein EHQ18_03300 [Leptospira kanakyensis]
MDIIKRFVPIHIIYLLLLGIVSILNLNCDFTGTVSIENTRDSEIMIELSFNHCIKELPSCFERPGLFRNSGSRNAHWEEDIKPYLSFKNCKLYLKIPEESTFYMSNVLNGWNTRCLPILSKIKYGNEVGFVEIVGEEILNSFESENRFNFNLKIPKRNVFRE